MLQSINSKLLALYDENRFDFRPNSSTLDAYLAIKDFVTREFDRIDVDGVAMIALDLSKAFDCFSHDSLMKTPTLSQTSRKISLMDN